MTTLYHRTCNDSLRLIALDDWMLRPNPQPYLGHASLIWMTDDPEASRSALGLTSWTLHCDRMQVLLAIPEPDRALRWRDWVNANGIIIPVGLRRGIPSRWWVSARPQRISQTEP